jgi:hypothetical protein
MIATCNFAPSFGEKEVYAGSINKFGGDIVAATQGCVSASRKAHWPAAVRARRRQPTIFQHFPPELLDERIVSFPVSGEK